MKTRFVPLLLLGVLAAAALSAETKTSGTVTCKTERSTPVALTDKPNHSFMIGKAQCAWTGLEFAGIKRGRARSIYKP